MIPRTLSEWTLDAIRELLDKKYYEQEHFDYKVSLPHSRNDADKLEMRKDCCAFANSSGGFLVFGIDDDRRLTTELRMVGIERDVDFPALFGDYPRGCNPSVRWDFKNPALEAPNGKYLHVVHISQSWERPHSLLDPTSAGFLFFKRTNKGNEPMSYEEVRLNFLGYYEKRVKLQLLKAELEVLLELATSNRVADDKMRERVPVFTFNVQTIDTIVADTFTVIRGDQPLVDALVSTKSRARIVNDRIHSFSSVLHFPMTGKDKMAFDHNTTLIPYLDGIIVSAGDAIRLLKPYLT